MPTDPDDILLEPASEQGATQPARQDGLLRAVGNVAGNVATGPYAIVAKLLTNFGVVGIICYLALQMHNEMIDQHKTQVNHLQGQLDRQSDLLSQALKMSDKNNQLLKAMQKELKDRK